MKRPTEMTYEEAKKWAQKETYLVEVVSQQMSKTSAMKSASELLKINDCVVITQNIASKQWIVIVKTETLRKETNAKD